ncbi:MAG: hypothetical protein IJO03_02545 [Clostridia bacterium]|nr:hypothetical protein [Clostridia bacterium]
MPTKEFFHQVDLSEKPIKRRKVKFFQAYKWRRYSLWLKLFKKERTLSQKDAVKDFEAFRFALDNLYCGKPFHEKNGTDFSAVYAEIQSFIENSKTVSSAELCKAYASALEGKFVDNHFRLLFPTEKKPVAPCVKRCLPYFSGITVENKNGSFVVVSTETDKVKVNDVIEDTGCFFPTLSPDRNKRYLVGMRSWSEQKSLEIVCNGEKTSVPLHLCRVAENEKEEIVFSLKKINGYNVIRSNTFCSFTDKTPTDAAKDIGEKLKNADVVIYDMHHNGGGNSTYSANFFEALNGYCADPFTAHILTTPYHSKTVKTRKWTEEKDEVDLSKAQYNGKVVVIADYFCGSSAEETVNFTKSLKSPVIVGTNTLGCNCFTNLWVCVLPKTHMAMYLPNIALTGMFEEGKGFEPDYWLDSKTPLDDVIEWLNS